MAPRLLLILFCLPSWILPGGLGLCLCSGALHALNRAGESVCCGVPAAPARGEQSCCGSQQPGATRTHGCRDCCVAVLEDSARLEGFPPDTGPGIQVPDSGLNAPPIAAGPSIEGFRCEAERRLPPGCETVPRAFRAAPPPLRI